MVNLVKVRASVFIPMSWTEPKLDHQSGITIEFEGDSREFTPFAVNTMRSRIEQEVIVDFHKKEIFTYANTGITTKRVTASNGSITKTSGKASIEHILCKHIKWTYDDVCFQMSASASNPLNAMAPTADFLLNVHVKRNGNLSIHGAHDGFPCYEFYKQVDFGPFEPIYIHDFRRSGDTAEALGGEMEYSFTKTL